MPVAPPPVAEADEITTLAVPSRTSGDLDVSDTLADAINALPLDAPGERITEELAQQEVLDKKPSIEQLAKEVRAGLKAAEVDAAVISGFNNFVKSFDTDNDRDKAVYIELKSVGDGREAIINNAFRAQLEVVLATLKGYVEEEEITSELQFVVTAYAGAFTNKSASRRDDL